MFTEIKAKDNMKWFKTELCTVPWPEGNMITKHFIFLFATAVTLSGSSSDS